MEGEISKACKILNEGGLVIFPTETVWGLGADALNEEAVRKIFEAKNRPFWNPVIVHVIDFKKALEFWEEEKYVLDMAEKITKEFWPGPLTLVIKCRKNLPKILRAGSEFLGIRCPNHEVALKLLKNSGCAIAAPSANKFQEISPTYDKHLKFENIFILGQGRSLLGVESTIIRLWGEDGFCFFSVLRRGSISVDMLKFENLFFRENNQNIFFPGRDEKHYSPIFPTFLIKFEDFGDLDEKIVFLDFSGKFEKIKEVFFFYRKIIQSESLSLKCCDIFDALHESENVLKKNGGGIILIENFEDEIQTEFEKCIFDRCLKSASSKKIRIKNKQILIV